MFIGIDLGTTNSSLAVFDGETVSIIPSRLGENLTPSVVRIDGHGGVVTGRRAHRFLETDPANTRAEWKRLMGTGERLRFEAANQELLPEELSAKVVAALLADARDVLGFTPTGAVISTPALFELPQNHATAQAGKLAGLSEVTLIQEPIASAIAAGWRAEQEGLWLVFDLGGGTLDVSLLATLDGRLRVVDHSGDNFLGGRDMDQALVNWAVAELKRDRGLPQLERENPRARRPLAKLKAACELAKIDLSRQEQTTLVVSELCEDDGGHPVDAELPVTRALLARLIEPFLVRAENVVRSLLARNQCGADEVARVVLVGGPTLMPAVRERILGLFGGRALLGIDPMTIVARGAALYAATLGLPARVTARPDSAKPGLAMRIEFPPVTADTEPYVVGRFLPGQGDRVPERVRIARQGSDGETVFGDALVSAEGSFVLQVTLLRHHQNQFRVRALDSAGQEIALGTNAFSIVHGVSVADPPLSRSVGVACANDTTQFYFAKGTPLPARRTFVHQTARAVAARGDEDVLAVPVVQGESGRAHRNRLIGMLQIRGLDQDLPAGSRIEITLQLDRSGQLHTRADIPALGKTFEEIAHVLVPTASMETAEREAEKTSERLDEVRRRAFQSGTAPAVQALGELPEVLLEVARLLPEARGGDADSGQKLHRLLLEANTALDDAEAILEWPDLEGEARASSLYYTRLVSQWGTPAEQQLFEQTLQAVADAQRGRNAVELERALYAMRTLGKAAYLRDPQTPEHEIDWLSAHVTEAMDVARAEQLIEKARAAHRQGQSLEVRAMLAQIWAQFPVSAEERQRSFGSGVR
jgi:molecular chaperone DnaK